MADSRKMVAFSAFLGVIAGVLVAACSSFFPAFYNTSSEVRELASAFILAAALGAPIQGILNASYFTLRSGGKTLLTFLFDSIYIWGFTIPLSYLMIRFTTLPIAIIYLICYNTDLIKCVLGLVLVERGIWINSFTENKNNTN